MKLCSQSLIVENIFLLIFCYATMALFDNIGVDNSSLLKFHCSHYLITLDWKCWKQVIFTSFLERKIKLEQGEKMKSRGVEEYKAQIRCFIR